MEELFNKLIEHYNEGYYEGVASNLIWNYHLDPPNWSRVMDCSKDSDGIKDLEQELEKHVHLTIWSKESI